MKEENILEKSSFTREEFIEWCETICSYALDDLFKSIDNGNLEAAKAHSERIKLVENMAPWLGFRSAYPKIKIQTFEE